MFDVFCVGGDLWDKLITHSEETHQMYVSKIFVIKKPQNKTTYAQVGVLYHRKKQKNEYHHALKHVGEGHLVSETIQYQTELSSVKH